MDSVRSYHVEWFVARDVRRDVTLRLREGELVDVESGRCADAIDLGPVALIPGLVNAHTHLEFSGLPQPIPTAGRFTDWIRAVMRHRREHPQSVTHAVRAGLRESVQSGTTLLGDIATTGWSGDDYADAQIPCVIFQEILGLLPERIAAQQELARSHLNAMQTERNSADASGETGLQYRGISPHAPYSTHRDLVDGAVRRALESGCPIAMHLAETMAEVELLDQGNGEFRELLTELGLWQDDFFPGGVKPIDYLRILARAPRVLVVHGNYLDDDALKFIAGHPNLTLVYCPRTHAAFDHAEHPWRRLLALGGQVAIGTDSRASNPDLSLFAELQFLALRYPDLSHIELLNLGSQAGRRALGCDQAARLDFTLIRVAESECRRPEEMLFAPDNRVCGTMIGGKWIWLSAETRARQDQARRDQGQS